MDNRKKSFVFYETGGSCSACFLMRDGEFHPTEDAVIIGISEGKTPKDAYRALVVENPWIKEYKTESVVAREIGEPTYL